MRPPTPPRPFLPPLRAAAAFAAVAAVLVFGWLWLRDSSLVAVQRVTVTGIDGPEAGRVRAALEEAGRDMTTLRVRESELRMAVEPFPAVAAVRARTDFPHGLRVEVREHVPIAAVASGSRQVPVAADGTLLHGSPVEGLPTIEAKSAPGGRVLTDPPVRRALAVLAAAPGALRPKVRRVYVGPNGLTLPLRSGPTVYFGRSERVRAKWLAVTTVLADPTSSGASYVDVRLPERAVAGGLEPPPAREDGESA